MCSGSEVHRIQRARAPALYTAYRCDASGRTSVTLVQLEWAGRPAGWLTARIAPALFGCGALHDKMPERRTPDTLRICVY